MSDDRITKKAPYGQHIALACNNHPDLRWSTKNISHIGARRIFYFDSLNGFKPECNCCVDELFAVEDLNEPDIEE